MPKLLEHYQLYCRIQFSRFFRELACLGLGVVFTQLANQQVQAQTLITNGADFNNAINSQASAISLQPASGGTISTVANSATGTRGTITYSSPFAGLISFETTISGNGHTLSGSNGATPLFIVSPGNEISTGAAPTVVNYSVSIANLTITNGLSQGGTGAQGGGAGLGGGVFAGAGALITLSDVVFTGNSAIGGNVVSTENGGGGGMGGNGDLSTISDGGGGGLFSNAPDSFFTGGNGGGANGGNEFESGGDGGFGGGGAAISGSGGFGGGGGGAAGGIGGFGGGGGALNETYSGLSWGGFGGGGTVGGFGGGGIGDARSGNYGGGGAGFGGAIFVQNKSAVMVTGNSTLAGNSVAGGSAASEPTWTSGYNGAAAGSEIFMMTGSSVTLAPGVGNTITIGAASNDAEGVASAVADDSIYSLSGEGLSTVGAGAGAVLTIGSTANSGGLVVLHGNNTYAGGTAIVAGTTLQVFQDSNLGAYVSGNSSIGSISLSDGSSLLTSANGFITGRAISGEDYTLAASSGTNATYHGTIVTSALTIGSATNNGSLVLTNSGNSMGSLAIVGGSLSVANQGALGGAVQGIELSSGGSLITSSDGFSTASNVHILDNGSLASATGSTAAYSGVISGGALTIGSTGNTGTVSLTGTNTHAGGTTINGGTLRISSVANLGASTGGLASNGGTIQMDFSGNISASRNVSLTNGASLVVSSGNSVTFASPISGDTITIGDGSSANNGTVVFTGHNTYNGNTRIDGATLQIGGHNSIGGGSVQFFRNGKLVVAADGLIISGDAVVDGNAGIAAAAGTSMSFNGRINGGGVTFGDATNTGTVILAEHNTFLDDTTVAGGTLLVNGSIDISPMITVQSGATLGGSGSVTGLTLENGANLAPGNASPASLNAISLTWNAGAHLIFDLGATTNDLLQLSGALNKAGSGDYVFAFIDAGWQAGQTYTLVDFETTNFTLGDFSYSNTGEFSGTFSLDGSTLKFEVTAVPEPATWLLVSLGLLLICGSRLKKAQALRRSGRAL